MANGWTGGQYSVLRVLLGIYLCIPFVPLLPWSAESCSRDSEPYWSHRHRTGSAVCRSGPTHRWLSWATLMWWCCHQFSTGWTNRWPRTPI